MELQLQISEQSAEGRTARQVKDKLWGNEGEGSLERDEAAGVGGADTRLAVLDGTVGDREFTEVVADHVALDLHLVEGFAVVHSNDGANHLGDNDHVAQVCADRFRALALLGISLGFPELLD